MFFPMLFRFDCTVARSGGDLNQYFVIGGVCEEPHS
jgi:hypothetical protein